MAEAQAGQARRSAPLWWLWLIVGGVLVVGLVFQVKDFASVRTAIRQAEGGKHVELTTARSSDAGVCGYYRKGQDDQQWRYLVSKNATWAEGSAPGSWAPVQSIYDHCRSYFPNHRSLDIESVTGAVAIKIVNLL
jgi:hypothetical protein